MDLRRLAWINVALHAVALAFSWFFLRRGSFVAPRDERLAYLAEGPLGWRIGWMVWAACAVVLVAFVLGAHRRTRGHGLGRLAVGLVLAGAVIDLGCDFTFAFGLPSLAAERSYEFGSIESAASLLSMCVANGLYSIAVPLITLALRARAGLSALGAALGWATWAAGAGLAVGGLCESVPLVQISAPATMLFYCGWAVVVARTT